MYSKINNKAIRNIIISVLGAILMTTVVVALAPKIEAFAETITTSSETKVVKSTSESSEVSSESSSSTETSSSSSVEENEVAEPSSTEEVQEPEVAYVEEAPVEASTVDTITTVAPSTDSYVAPNGNTAGAIGSAAAAQMAAATGVPQSTWEAIIARESNGDPNVANASGASGLFQTMPGWGSTATVEDQIATAITVYNTQGLSAWGY